MPRDEARRAFATEVVARLKEAGFQALWAGGCVRDLILGLEPADYDVATSATPEQVMAIFRRTVPVGVSFGVVRVLGPEEAGEVEVATFRSDGAYLDGRRPESVQFGDARHDAERRDFTINGMFLDPLEGEVVDFVGGRADLDARVVRAIGHPADRFAEDKLRLVRAVRFAARFGMEIEPGTMAALKAMAGEVRVVSAERIAQELRKMLVHPTRARAMALAMEVGLIDAILPPLVRAKGLFQGKPVQPDGDLWDHTLLVLDLLPAESSFSLAFAALLHDAGKPDTKGLRNGRTSFHNHEQVGRAIADRLARDLKLANHERERVAWLVEYHQYLGEATRLREAKLKRILAEPGIDELLALHRADALASTGDAGHVDYCEAYLRDQPAGPINPPPLLNGHDLARHGLKSGPQTRTAPGDGPRSPARPAHPQQERGAGVARPPARRAGGRGPSGRPSLNAVGVDHLDPGPGIARREPERERDDLAGEDLGAIRRGLPDQDESAFEEPVEFQGPRLSVDEEQFPDPKLGVEIQLLARSVVGADDLDGEVGAAEPVRAFVDGHGTLEEHGDVGASKVLGPILSSIADSWPGSDDPKPGEANRELKGQIDQSGQVLMLVVRWGGHDIHSTARPRRSGRCPSTCGLGSAFASPRGS